MSISAELGYPDDSLEPRVAPSRQPEIQKLLERLRQIDDRLEEALEDSMAVAIGDLKVDYNQHLAHLSSEGDRLLRRLSALVSLPIAYNRYTKAGSQSSPYAVKSYW